MKIIINKITKRVESVNEIKLILFENSEIQFVKLIKNRREHLILKQGKSLKVVLADKNAIRFILLKKDKNLLMEYIVDYFNTSKIKMDLVWDKIVYRKKSIKLRLYVLFVSFVILSFILYLVTEKNEITGWLMLASISLLSFYFGLLQCKKESSNYTYNRAIGSVVIGIIGFIGSVYWIIHGIILMLQ